MRDKIVLIDGHSILNRAFYGLPDLTNAAGRHTNAVYGFLNILFKILDEEKPQYLAVAFDLSAPTFRHKLYPEYKGTRHEMPSELREQIPLAKETLTAMGVPVFSLEGYEADDILGTVARVASEAGLDVRVISGDRDLLQLATDRVMIRIPKTKAGGTLIEDYHDSDVLETMGVRADQIVDLKALMGDSSDNIPGIPGVGVKTATKIISEHGSIEAAHDHIEEIAPKRAQESLRDHWDLAVLSKELAKIDTQVPMEINLDAAKLSDLYTPEAYAIFRELEFKNFFNRFDPDAAVAKSDFTVPVVMTEDEARAWIERAAGAESVGVHLLGTVDPMRRTAKVTGLALALSYEETAYLPARLFSDAEELSNAAARILREAGHPAVNGVKAQLALADVPPRDDLFDLTLAAYLLDPLASDYPGERPAREYGGAELPSAEEIFGGKKIPPADEMEEEQAALFAGQQACAAVLSREKMLEALREQGMEDLYREIELPLAFVLHDMETAGVAVKKEELAAYGASLSGRIAELEQAIYEQAGEEFNIQSPKQLGVILFEKMALPGGKKTKTGYSTAADVLERLAPEVPFVSDILEYRQLTKLKSTYADALGGYVADDGRIHTNYQQTVTATGRLSSADPNLQNIPVRVELGRQIRKVFVPREACVFIDADYSQIELRVLAHCSGDPKLINAYREEKDIHAITASQVFHVPFEEVTPQLRRNAKAVNFGIVYGISSFGLSQDLSITRKEAEEYIRQYFATYPGIKTFLDNAVAEAKEKGYSTTLYGRRRPIPELKSSNFMQRSFGERVAMNAPIQGAAADIIKIAMIRVQNRLREEGLASRLLIQVHDELLIEAPEAEAEIAEKILSEEMTRAAELAVKLEVDMHRGNNWYEAK